MRGRGKIVGNRIVGHGAHARPTYWIVLGAVRAFVNNWLRDTCRGSRQAIRQAVSTREGVLAENGAIIKC